MTTDATSSTGPDVHGRLAVELRAFLDEHPAAPFSDVSLEERASGGRAVVLVERRRGGRFAIAVRGDTVDPRSRDAVASARDHARRLDADCFATCNSNDFFLLGSPAEAGVVDLDYYYLDLGSQPLSACVPSIIDAVDSHYRDGRLPDQSHREQLVGTLQSFHESVWPAFETAAADAYERDPAFTDAFDDWVETNEYRGRRRADLFEIAAKRYAYLAMIRALRSEVDRRRSGPVQCEQPTASSGVARPESLVRPDEGTGARGHPVSDDPRESVWNLDASVDDLPSVARSDLFETFPRPEETRRRVVQLAQNLEGEPIDGVDADVLGEVYEALIPEDERKAHGQFYTHPAIAETLVRWALQPADDLHGVSAEDAIPRVLDPAAGSGTFVVEAYRQIAERFPTASHQELVDHVVAVDVNRFPLHLAALTLASQRIEERTDRVRAYHASFFDLAPSTRVPADSRIDASCGGVDGDEIGLVDAVVGNPPYVEASDLSPDKEHFRAHLGGFGPDDATPYEDGAKAIGANADAYVYFVTHATQFLRDGGRLGVVVPTKWMSSRYGEQFQQFLYDHYAIEAVVGFDARAFEDALVDTALLLLERCADEDQRRSNVVEFVQLHGRVGPETVLGTLENDEPLPDDGPTITTAGHSRTVAVRQSALEDDTAYGKVAHYLVAPAELIELVESPELVELDELADVVRGAMTGSTSFFFPDGGDVDDYGIEDEFLLPALKSVRGCDTIQYDDADVDRWFVDVHPYVDDVRDRPNDRGADDSVERTVKRALESDGHTGLLSWIRHAEREGDHLGTTCQSREVWFDAGEPPRPSILLQKLLRERLFSVHNRAGAVPSNAVDCIDVHPDVDSKVLFGVLNSSIALAIMEVWGRNEAGMLQLMTYETKSLPVPDVRSMTDEERSAIREVVDDVLERGASELSREHRDRLDAAVLDALDASVDLSVERIQSIQRFVLDRRVASGETVDVLVGERGVVDESGP